MNRPFSNRILTRVAAYVGGLACAGCVVLVSGGCGASPPETDVPAVEMQATAAPTPTTETSARPSTRTVARNTSVPDADPFPMDPVTHVLILPSPVLYDTGKATLKKASDAPLTFVKDYLDQNPAVTTLRIEGHSDSMGSDAANQKLTEGRAKAAAEWLVAHGIDCHRLVAVGFGESRPIADNKTTEGRTKNRRMDFVEAGYVGRPINGLPIDGGGTPLDIGCP